MPLHSWHVDASAVRLEAPRFSLLVDPLDPARGIQDVRIDGRPLQAFAPLGVDLPRVAAVDAATSLDYYLRGGDLVATYADRPQPAMRAQVAWRAASHALQGAVAALELLCSVQTNLLDSCPRLSTLSVGPAAEILRLADPERGAFLPIVPAADIESRADSTVPHCYLVRLPSIRLSYVEMAHPADARASRCVRESTASGMRFRLGHELFAEQLEKGVILRARVLGVLLDRDGDETAATRHYDAFLSAELPLTT